MVDKGCVMGWRKQHSTIQQPSEPKMGGSANRRGKATGAGLPKQRRRKSNPDCCRWDERTHSHYGWNFQRLDWLLEERGPGLPMPYGHQAAKEIAYAWVDSTPELMGGNG